MILTAPHRLYGQPAEICIIRMNKNVLEWTLYIFDGIHFYPASSIGTWPQFIDSTQEAIRLARLCQKTTEWKDYPIAIYYGNDGFSYLGTLHERRVIEDDNDIVQHLLANS